jgi:hypothetical protein
MHTPRSLISELEEVLQRGSVDKSADVLRRVTDLFLATPQCCDETVELYDDIIERLIGHFEKKVLIELSKRLAPTRPRTSEYHSPDRA